MGAIQVPADGQPIVLMNDRQTIGGYPKIGSVLSLDIAALAQLIQIVFADHPAIHHPNAPLMAVLPSRHS